MKYMVIILQFILLFSINCKRDKSITDRTEDQDIKKAIVTISWEGEYEVDGCGFFIFIENNKYKAINEDIIGDEFKTDTSSSAQIEYIDLHEKIDYYCGDAPWSYEIDGIEIITITKL